MVSPENNGGKDRFKWVILGNQQPSLGSHCLLPSTMMLLHIKSWKTTVEDLGTTECKRHFFCIENALQKMRTAVPALIQELQEACRLSLYNGNSLGLEVFKKPRDGSNPSTTKRRRQDVTSTKPRDWETVRSVLDAPMEYSFSVRCFGLLLMIFAADFARF